MRERENECENKAQRERDRVRETDVCVREKKRDDYKKRNKQSVHTHSNTHIKSQQTHARSHNHILSIFNNTYILFLSN